jgi:DNA-binding transcriptional LysR family regulator
MELEQRIQTRLLYRTTRNVTLSEDGKAYFESCEKVLALLDEAAQRITSDRAGGGALRIVAHPLVGPEVLSRLLHQYRAAAPGVKVMVQVTDCPVNMLEDRFDIGILPSELIEQGNVFRQTLRRTRRIFAAAPCYLSASARLRRAADLERHTMLLGSAVSPCEQMLAMTEAGNRVTVPIGYHLTGSDVVLRASVLEGMGIAWLPEDMIAADMAASRLQRVLPECELSDARLDLCIFYLDKQFMSGRCRSFIDLCVGYFRNSEGHAPLLRDKARQLRIA